MTALIAFFERHVAKYTHTIQQKRVETTRLQLVATYGMSYTLFVTHSYVPDNLLELVVLLMFLVYLIVEANAVFQLKIVEYRTNTGKSQ